MDIKKVVYKILKLFGFIKEKSNDMFNGALIAGDRNLIKIVDNVSFGGNVLLHAEAEIEIGDNTMIAFQTVFYTATHDYNDHPLWYKKVIRLIKVGKYVWIGLGSIILTGVIIGDYSVVAAGSVVNANIPTGSIVAGNPARIIRMRENKKYTSKQIVQKWEQSISITKSYLTNYCKIK